MKLLFISDIHGIVDNLNYIENLLTEEKFDKLIVLGDLYYMGFNSIDNHSFNNTLVKDFLYKNRNKLICMRGNCDSDVDIVTSDFPIASGLSLINVDGIDIYITHGHEYNIESKRHKFNNCFLVYGHKHFPFIEKVEDVTYINTGSISLPRNNSNPTYLVYEDRKFTIYDIYGNKVDEIYC
ncbi:MAG: phosphodiesterase [Bacilli bacterium]|nr:phosphodiesterase [Bacilli bacterium]